MKSLEFFTKKSSMSKNYKALLSLGVLLLLITALSFPLATIWAMNSLFKLSIAYTFQNWISVVILILTIQAALNVKQKR